MYKFKKPQSPTVLDHSGHCLYTDGSFLRSPNDKNTTFGAWAFIHLKDDEVLMQNAQPVFNTTSQRMELEAIVQGLSYLKNKYLLSDTSELNKSSVIKIYSDSMYCKHCVNSCLSWKRQGWKKWDESDVKNVDLLKRLLEVMYDANDKPLFKVKHIWVLSHTGIKYNEQCDELARGIAERMRSGKIQNPVVQI